MSCPTHQFTNNYGQTYRGIVLGEAVWNLVWFLPLCNDGITYMKEPICTAGVRSIAIDDNDVECL